MAPFLNRRISRNEKIRFRAELEGAIEACLVKEDPGVVFCLGPLRFRGARDRLVVEGFVYADHDIMSDEIDEFGFILEDGSCLFSARR